MLKTLLRIEHWKIKDKLLRTRIVRIANTPQIASKNKIIEVIEEEKQQLY